LSLSLREREPIPKLVMTLASVIKNLRHMDDALALLAAAQQQIIVETLSIGGAKTADRLDDTLAIDPKATSVQTGKTEIRRPVGFTERCRSLPAIIDRIFI
jgi:hypothetical protein